MRHSVRFVIPEESSLLFSNRRRQEDAVGATLQEKTILKYGE